MIRVDERYRSGLKRERRLRARPMGVDTYQESVVYMREDCAVCRSEGFESQSRIRIEGNGRSLVATLNVVRADWLGHGEAGLSDAAWRQLGADQPCDIEVSHPHTIESFGAVRGRLFGRPVTGGEFRAVIEDITARRYSDVQLSAFVASCVGPGVSRDEVVSLTRAMVDVGQTLRWDRPVVFDKHCVGGLPGNRTSPLVVAIAAACGLIMPKTSSRAITSPAGTADTMETLTDVELSLPDMRRVVEREGGCLVWGGSVNLSPADDVLIRVERVLDLDGEAQLVASVLSKKLAAGSTHALIDVPVGPTAKVRDAAGAEALSDLLRFVGSSLGLTVDVLVTDGTQPVGRGIGPALEAWDLLGVLQGRADAPADLRERAAALAGAILERGGVCGPGEGVDTALAVLADGRAWRKFQAICEAQGGLREPLRAPHRAPAFAARSGRVVNIDNRRLARLAKLAGAPQAPTAGVELLVHLGDRVQADQPVLYVHAEAPGELAYALTYLDSHPELIVVEDGP
ncbi:MAG: thymidine phosphorylase [Gammaproteobacteria bacterium]|nr:thymidine phosphorylase [Gammaproteobacteria bacterium]MBK80990.1 thymidine phosphorylase [Gammaproteobacteria bacterium]